jgi:hypothetical protein
VNQPTKVTIVPAGPPAQSGNVRRYVQTDRLFRNSAGSGSYATAIGEFEITHPSTRLFACAFFGFLPDTQEDAVIPAGFTVALDAWGKTATQGIGGGRRMRGNSIIPGPFALPGQLPFAYEAVTGVDQWRGRLSIPAGGTGLAVDGYFVVSVSWEPAPGDNIGDEDLRKLFESCRVTPGAGSGGTIFNTFIP